MWVYLITPTLPSLKESWRTFILASCLSAFETDISRSDIILVLCIEKEMDIKNGYNFANHKLFTLFHEESRLIAQWKWKHQYQDSKLKSCADGIGWQFQIKPINKHITLHQWIVRMHAQDCRVDNNWNAGWALRQFSQKQLQLQSISTLCHYETSWQMYLVKNLWQPL